MSAIGDWIGPCINLAMPALECGDLSPLWGLNESGDKSPHSKVRHYLGLDCLALRPGIVYNRIVSKMVRGARWSTDRLRGEVEMNRRPDTGGDPFTCCFHRASARARRWGEQCEPSCVPFSPSRRDPEPPAQRGATAQPEPCLCDYRTVMLGAMPTALRGQ